jgi:hypothetical protein
MTVSLVGLFSHRGDRFPCSAEHTPYPVSFVIESTPWRTLVIGKAVAR